MMVKSEFEDCSIDWSEEYDSLPLSARLKLLVSRKQISDSMFLNEVVDSGQSELTRSIMNGEENWCFSSEEEMMLPRHTGNESFFDAKMLDSPSSQASDCSLSYPSSPNSSGNCVVSHGGVTYEVNCNTSSISSSKLLCNDRSPISEMAVSALQRPVVTYIPSKANEYGDVALTKILVSSSSVPTQGINAKDEISVDFDNDLENVVLRERRKMLLSRVLVKSEKPCIQACRDEMPKLSLFSDDAVQPSVLTTTEDSYGEKSSAGNLQAENIDYDNCFPSNTSKSYINDTSGAIMQDSVPPSDKLLSDKSVESTSDIKLYDTEGRSMTLPSHIRVKVEPLLSEECDIGGNHVKENSTSDGIHVKRDIRVDNGATKDDYDHLSLTDQPILSSSIMRRFKPQIKNPRPTAKGENDLLNAANFSVVNIIGSGPSTLAKHKPSDLEQKGKNNSKSVSSFPSAISVKIESLMSNEIGHEEKTYQGKLLSRSLVPLKTEDTTSPEASGDELDHMSLLDRLMLLSTDTSPSSKVSTNLSFPSTSASAIPSSCRGVLDSVDSITVTRPRKRKRTATNSAETALEEDVPGLLKVLIDKGVSLKDIKLYGEPESDEAIDESFCEDSFTELEAVIWKIFSHRESLLKVNPVCGSKETKVTYCLGCLFSLVEQARCIRSKNWPAEWGWSRDLQAFIFVFQKHNRIVMERPEYGYATYFFEMLDSVSVGWQVRRLVTAMKLAGCGRISLLENRALMVGEDLSEGEARILSQYGWVPNTGLATMLNYCGRVVHDTNKERDGNEWRHKIGKMLVDGYNGGSLMPRFLVKKSEEDESMSNPEVKLEIDHDWASH